MITKEGVDAVCVTFETRDGGFKLVCHISKTELGANVPLGPRSNGVAFDTRNPVEDSNSSEDRSIPENEFVIKLVGKRVGKDGTEVKPEGGAIEVTCTDGEDIGAGVLVIAGKDCTSVLQS